MKTITIPEVIIVSNTSINDLISKAGFWMSRNLIQRVLKASGEL